MANRNRVAQFAAAAIASVLGLFVTTGSEAKSGYLTDFNNTYPSSNTANAAGCLTCHGVSGSGGADTRTFNRFGDALASRSGTIAARLAAIAPQDSDGEGHTNLAEITANAQPGWCVATAPGCNNNGFTAPSSIGLLDPAPANQAPTANAGGPYSATAGTPVSLSGSGSSDPDGSIASYAWTFGDGSSGTGVSPSVTYSSAGSFTVTLTVTDNLGASSAPASTTVTVNVGLQAPVANAGGPYSGAIGQQVAFDGTQSSDPDGSVVSYAWDFGDGNTGTGSAPVHSYAAGGAFTVKLTVTDNDNLTGTDTATTTITDGSGVQPPVASAGGPYAGSTGVAIQFDGSGSADPDGTIALYEWDFGDGQPGSGVRPMHAYAAAGLYTVTLTVTDNMGLDSTPASTQATVQQMAGGAALYDANCAVCHGDPWGGSAVDPGLSGTKRVAGARVCTIEGAIFGTSVFPDGVPDMVGFGNQRLTADEVAAIAGYLNSRDTDGEQRYITGCAGCHGNDGRGGRVDEGVVGDDAGDIRQAILGQQAMQFLSCLPASDRELMGAFLTGDGQQSREECKLENDCDADGRPDDVDDDDDNDGMPDEYEESKGFNPYDPADAKEDADRDGKSNLAEYRAGTDPLDASSKPVDSSGGVGSIDATSLFGLALILLAGQRRRTLVPARHPGSTRPG